MHAARQRALAVPIGPIEPMTPDELGEWDDEAIARAREEEYEPLFARLRDGEPSRDGLTLLWETNFFNHTRIRIELEREKRLVEFGCWVLWNKERVYKLSDGFRLWVEHFHEIAVGTVKEGVPGEPAA